jgi:hypothetical protein
MKKGKKCLSCPYLSFYNDNKQNIHEIAQAIREIRFWVKFIVMDKQLHKQPRVRREWNNPFYAGFKWKWFWRLLV